MSCVFLVVVSLLAALLGIPEPPKPEPKYRADGYLKNWPKFAKRKKKAKGWICQECGVDCSSEPKLVHLHHVNGDKKDNTDQNLAVLCIHCHAVKPGRGHQDMKWAAKSDGRWASVAKLKKAQGVEQRSKNERSVLGRSQVRSELSRPCLETVEHHDV
jgi:hypothetical protein